MRKAMGGNSFKRPMVQQLLVRRRSTFLLSRRHLEHLIGVQMATQAEWRNAASNTRELIILIDRVYPHTLLQGALNDLKTLESFLSLAINEDPLAYPTAISCFKAWWSKEPIPAKALTLLTQYRFQIRKMSQLKRVCGDKKNRLELSKFLKHFPK
jgi:hypothetical protein